MAVDPPRNDILLLQCTCSGGRLLGNHMQKVPDVQWAGQVHMYNRCALEEVVPPRNNELQLLAAAVSQADRSNADEELRVTPDVKLIFANH